MIIYLEKQAKKYNLTKSILDLYKDCQIIEVDNYKNIFDKNINFTTEKCLIIAKLSGNGITETPPNYSKYKKAFFFKSSLNCIFDCSYCYLKGAFKNNFQVIFVNYEDIQLSIKSKIEELRLEGFSDKIMFYASDYSDNLATENITQFHKHFIPFFEQFDNILMETRTKSVNIKGLLELGFVPKNTEIAFSLNPAEIIDKYEKGTSKLNQRIVAINELLGKNYKVGIRFLPLLNINNYLQIYANFLDYITREIDLSQVNSIEIGSLLYTKEDYNKILKKESHADFLYRLSEEDSKFIRNSREFRKNIYELFLNKLKNFNICLDNYEK